MFPATRNALVRRLLIAGFVGSVFEAASSPALFAAAPAAPLLKDDAPRVAKPAEAAKPASAAEQDLEAMQGVWTYEFANAAGVKMRVEKKIDGTGDVVTQYDAAGNVVHAHASTFQLAQHGPLRVFTILTSVNTAGPDMGVQRGKLPRSYVYRIEGNNMIEAWGLLDTDRGPPRFFIWQKRVDGR